MPQKKYSMNPATIMKLVFSLRRTHIIIFTSAAIVVAIIMFLMFESDNIKGIIGFSWFLIFLLIMDIWALIIVKNLKTYSAVKKIVFEVDGFTITTAKNKQFRIRYEDLGLIDATKGVKLPTEIFYYPWVKVIYYNHQIGKCIELYLSREAGEALVEEYKRYCETHNCAPCPILDGIVETSEVEDRAIKRIKSSSFCNRRVGGR